MAIKYLEDNDWKKEVKEGSTVVNYYADWCGPCQMLTPVLEELSNDVKVIKINVDQYQSIAKENGVSGIPATFFFKDGVKKDEAIGFLPLELLKQKADSL